MGFKGSLLGATVGWWMGGPVGAIVGLVVGHVAEESSSVTKMLSEEDNSRQARGGFIASMLILMAAVMKADGKVVHAELEYVKAYLIRNLGQQKTAEALIMLRDILKQQIPLQDVCLQIRINLDYSSRLELVHFLIGLATSDGRLDAAELSVIRQIALNLGISESDIGSLGSMYKDDLESAYKVLEVDSAASDEDIKKAYRQMAVRFHPDKVEHLGEEFKKSANEKFQRVNEAYEKIKKERNFK
ncbi:MAG: TerB family tellurite resistance protein [Breznakibacter sp.]